MSLTQHTCTLYLMISSIAGSPNSPLDVSKYKIQTLSLETNRGAAATKTGQNFSNGKSDMSCRPTDDTSRRQPSPNDKPRRRQAPDIFHQRSKSEDRDKRKVADVLDKFNEVLENDDRYIVSKDYKFKISSTEDNYMYDKFKAKSKVIYDKNDRTGEDNALVSGKDVYNINSLDDNAKAGETNEDSVKAPDEIIQVKVSKESKEHNNGKDFLTKHRHRINKLKRRFFEAQTTPKPLPVEHVSPKTNKSENTESELKERDDFAKDYSKNSLNNGHFATESRASLLKNVNVERRRRHSADGTVGRSGFDNLRMRWSSGSEQYAVVVAVDFGTTYSGYAYSFVDDPGKANSTLYVYFLFKSLFTAQISQYSSVALQWISVRTNVCTYIFIFNKGGLCQSSLLKCFLLVIFRLMVKCSYTSTVQVF